MVKLSDKAKENKAKYNAEYEKKMVKQIKFGLNRNTMNDVIEWLDTKDNKQGYIIELIRDDIKPHSK